MLGPTIHVQEMATEGIRMAVAAADHNHNHMQNQCSGDGHQTPRDHPASVSGTVLCRQKPLRLLL